MLSKATKLTLDHSVGIILSDVGLFLKVPGKEGNISLANAFHAILDGAGPILSQGAPD